MSTKLIENTEGFIRATNNEGALINTNNTALEAYKKQKKRFNKIDQLEKRIDNIEGLLREILNKL